MSDVASPLRPHETLPPVPAWLDEIEGEQALHWVGERNTETLTHLSSPRRDELESSILEILDSPERIPHVSERAGWFYNFWTDAEHPRGLWRRTTPESYLSESETEWELLLDLDALGEQEGHTWVWHGAQVLRSTGKRALITLSDGGSDADLTREFDLETKTFISPEEGSFYRPESKGFLQWADDAGESVLYSNDFGPGSLTASGYPRQARRQKRGQDIADAEILGTCATDAVALHPWRDVWGQTWLSVMPDFFTNRTWLLDDVAPVPDTEAASYREAAQKALEADGELISPQARLLDLPATAETESGPGWLLVTLREDWTVDATTYPSGSLLAIRLAEFLDGQRSFTTLFTPTAATSLADATWTTQHLVLNILDDVVNRVEVLTPPATDAPAGTSWRRREADLSALLPETGVATPNDDADHSLLRPGRPLITVGVGAVNTVQDDRLWISASSWNLPNSLALAEINAEGELTGLRVLQSLSARFDAEGVQITQHVAISDDGTRVPYFQIGKPSERPAPTILYGYGGFEHSLLPGYQATTGKAWLERGGVYVVANIRGGGEYGPAWHSGAVKENRLRCYEDFASVARALIERGVATPSSLAVHGGSNGGLLVGVMLTRYPELFGAVVCEVPLLDMGRYTHLLAGASWEAEYGDPDNDAQWEFLREFSPFHLLREGVEYPPVLFITSTRDDRVHPAHARTMAYRLREQLGARVEYFENSEGGHGRASTSAQRAQMLALMHEFCWQNLEA